MDQLHNLYSQQVSTPKRQHLSSHTTQSSNKKHLLLVAHNGIY